MACRAPVPSLTRWILWRAALPNQRDAPGRGLHASLPWHLCGQPGLNPRTLPAGALCRPWPGTPGEFLDEALHMGIDHITGLCQMLTWRRHVVPVLHTGARRGEVTDIAAQRDDAKRCPQFLPGDVSGSVVRDVQPLPAQQCHHVRRCRGVWLRSRRGDLHLEATLCRQVLTIRCREDTFGGIVRTQKYKSARHDPFSSFLAPGLALMVRLFPVVSLTIPSTNVSPCLAETMQWHVPPSGASVTEHRESP